MKNGRKLRRSVRHSTVMASLARARPASLDADVLLRGHWPDATEIMEAAALADDGQTCYLAGTRRKQPGSRAGRLASSDGGKLVGAMASAAVTAVVIVIAVAIGTVTLGPASSAGHSLTSGPAINQLIPPTFHVLPLGAHWHGRVAYATGDGVVFLMGAARLSGPLDPLATLPPPARPARRIQIVTSFGFSPLGPAKVAVVGSIEVAASGLISVTEPSSRQANQVTFVSLDGVSFPIGSG